MASQPVRTLRSEDEVSHCIMVGLLGAGGMSEVHLAQDLALELRAIVDDYKTISTSASSGSTVTASS